MSDLISRSAAIEALRSLNAASLAAQITVLENIEPTKVTVAGFMDGCLLNETYASHENVDLILIDFGDKDPSSNVVSLENGEGYRQTSDAEFDPEKVNDAATATSRYAP